MAGPAPNPLYPTQFRSKFGPKYHYKPSVLGLNFTQLSRVGVKLGAFGGVALFGVIFIASNVPRLRRDVLQNVPILGGLFIKESLPASDNDEVFHIPQAQVYCQNRFAEWDDKITTPPGLCIVYLGSVFFRITEDEACEAGSLRLHNAFATLLVFFSAVHCRHEIERQRRTISGRRPLQTISSYSLLTGLNISLFPVLFFFSGLYYTDVVSTLIVLIAYHNHLRRVGGASNSILNSVYTVVLGVSSLCLRQTNIFWVVVYMGGLEAVHAIRLLKPAAEKQQCMIRLTEYIKHFVWRSSIGDIHDLPLNLAWPHNLCFSALSIGVAVVCNPVQVLKWVWPHVTIMGCFVSFIVWNGGVVLGDKSNHVATIHLPQMLYIWPFFAFFSAPLLLPAVLGPLRAVRWIFQSLTSQSSKTPRTDEKPRDECSVKSPQMMELEPISSSRHHRSDRRDDKRGDCAHVQIMRDLFHPRSYHYTIWVVAALVCWVIVLKNTIIHPFTLADNRHYMFYIFRYTILASTRRRELFVFAYLFCFRLCWAALAPCSPGVWSQMKLQCSAYYFDYEEAPPYTCHPLWGRVRTSESLENKTRPDLTKTLGEAVPKGKKRKGGERPIAPDGDEPPQSSTVILLFLATTLSLMTAPLVEPRYFILPWVFWRLLVPAWRVHEHTLEGERPVLEALGLGWLSEWGRRTDLRAVLETVWFLLINGVTMAIFLLKPYVWKAEDGSILDGGRLQRFMW
ncbi:hypothetical protein ACHAQA_007084 [Verticillium albo-atrum]